MHAQYRSIITLFLHAFTQMCSTMKIFKYSYYIFAYYMFHAAPHMAITWIYSYSMHGCFTSACFLFRMWFFLVLRVHFKTHLSMQNSYTSGYYVCLVSTYVATYIQARHAQLELIQNCKRSTCRECINYIVKF